MKRLVGSIKTCRIKMMCHFIASDQMMEDERAGHGEMKNTHKNVIET